MTIYTFQLFEKPIPKRSLDKDGKAFVFPQVGVG